MSNKGWAALSLLLLFYLGLLAIFKPLKVIKMSEGRWSLGIKLGLEGKVLSGREIALCRIFGGLMCSFVLAELYRLFW